MEISVFGKYRIKCEGKYSYNTPSYDCPNDWHTEKVKWQKTISGGELMEFVAKLLNDRDIINASIYDDVILTETYRPDGSGGNYKYEISRVEEWN